MKVSFPLLPATISLLCLCGTSALHAQTPSFVPLSFLTGENPQTAATADFNGDGKADIVSASLNGGTISVLLGNGDGTFGSPLITTVAYYPQVLAIGDFNADGFPDLVTSDGTTEDIFVLLGKGDGTFQPPLTLTGSALDVAVGDFNGDGKLDIAVAQGNGLAVFSG